MTQTAQIIQFPASAGQTSEQPAVNLEKRRREYYDYLGTKQPEIDEAKEARRYYHGAQWTTEEIKTLKKRKQPVVTANRIVRKIDAVVGLVERLRQDPKGYARTPAHEQGAELATAVLRFVLDDNEWKGKSPEVARTCAIEGIGGIEYDLSKGDHGDPDLEIHIVDPDSFFYDPRSYRAGFSDARFMGTAKWVDEGQAKELFPGREAEIDALLESGSDLTQNSDRDKVWVNTTQKKLRLVDHWYVEGGKWRWCVYIGNTELMSGESPFIDEKGKTFPRYRMFSASVDHDGDRYGFIRNLKSPQDEINHRRSKALHNLNTRRIIAQKGQFPDVEVARREAARPDGFLEYNPIGNNPPQFDDQRQLADMKGQIEFLEDAKNEIENFGPNPALIGQGLEDSSGRAISLLQQAGIAELGPYLLAYKQWKTRVYRDIWNIVQRTWTSERWIRVTDDQDVAQYFQINKLGLNEYGQPAITNAIGSLDVDIILDEGPDAVNMMADNYAVLQSLGPAFAQEFPEIAIELSPMTGSLKKRMLEKIQQKQSQPPPPDPKVIAMQQQAQLEAQKAQADFQMEQQRQATELQFKHDSMLLDAEIERQKAASQIQLEREKAAAQMEIEAQKASHQQGIERVKAANAIEIERARGETRNEIDRERAKNQAAAKKKKAKEAA